MNRMRCLFASMIALTSLFIVSANSLAVAAQKSAQPAPMEKLPWTLRDHYTFSGGPLRLDYAKEYAEWRIKLFEEDSDAARMNPDVLVRDVGFLIEMSDGRILTQDLLAQGGETIMSRDPFESPHLGAGTSYAVTFAPHDGILVRHKLETFKQYSFVFITLSVENQSGAPVGIRKIVSAVFGPGSISGFSAQVRTGARALSFCGVHPVFDKGGPASHVFFNDPGKGVHFSLGLMPSGRAAGLVDIQASGGVWQGRIESAFAPEKTLAPGAVLQGDAVYVNYGAQPVVADMYYAWSLKERCMSVSSRAMPRAWATIPDTEGISTLCAQASAAASLGISHALIPGNWEKRPGSLEGASPRYPKNIGDAAKDLRNAGATPGITVDPLLGQDGGNAWSAQSADGQTWINPGAPQGREYAVKRVRELIDKGFALIVVEPTRMDDAVLKSFDLTRAEANTLALAAAHEAASGGSTVVAAASRGQISGSRDEWLQAAACLDRLSAYDIAASPVRVLFPGKNALDEETMMAMRLCRFPIEFVGTPTGALAGQIAEVLRTPALAARPQDAWRDVPLVWLANVASPALGAMGMSLISFGGADAYPIADIEKDSSGAVPALLWRGSGDAVVEIREGAVPAATQLCTHGLITTEESPVFAGTADNGTLGLNRATQLQWHAERGVLSGQLEGPVSSSAYVYVPSSWSMDAAKVNGQKARVQQTGNWIVLPLGGGGGSFEVEFVRK